VRETPISAIKNIIRDAIVDDPKIEIDEIIAQSGRRPAPNKRFQP
jgi:hypothetical protein